MKTVLVIAGTYEQFRNYVTKLAENATVVKKEGRPYPSIIEDKRYVFVDDPIYIQGLRNAEVVKIGTWYHRKNLAEIEFYAELASRP